MEDEEGQRIELGFRLLSEAIITCPVFCHSKLSTYVIYLLIYIYLLT